MNGDNIHCKALDKASVSMAMAERVGLHGYSILSYAIFSPRRAHGWTFTRKGSIEVIRVEAEALQQLYPNGLGCDATLV
ncbi:MAG: hypothetical protein IPP10_13625 [Candidatus Competibacteraceae bacterium]|nr:hypothetical protein [Candidatus Competibacteraceae bacterium]MBK7984710.1 hypothetical protein [Candidatus Competibacteraceae bacterium]MBK8899524.1 hypothetical protein [Candidatus Competibacteraceae bacterium]MBK8964527.1 hypothetical protein [Candidatus Competibacteraceae bacterium]MBK9952521.1 hypothetical protein [Candidatus Competibacteraceae bacterium]